MSAFADLLDLRTAVVERVKTNDIVDVFPQLVRLAESDMNRRLRTREMVAQTTLTVTGGVAALPSDFEEVVGVYDGQGVEYIMQPAQALQEVQSRGYYAIVGSNLIAKNDEVLTLQYYARLPTISTGMTASNWLLQRHPSLYLYAVAFEAAKYLANPELGATVQPMLDMEYRAVDASDASRYARSRVRVQGPTP